MTSLPGRAWVQVVLDSITPTLNLSDAGTLTSSTPLVSVGAALIGDSGVPVPVGVECDSYGNWLLAIPASMRGQTGAALVIDAIDAVGNRATLIHRIADGDPPIWVVAVSSDRLLRLEPTSSPVYSMRAVSAHASA